MRKFLFVPFPRLQFAALSGYIAWGDARISLARVLPDLRRAIWMTYERPRLLQWQMYLAEIIR